MNTAAIYASAICFLGTLACWGAILHKLALAGF